MSEPESAGNELAWSRDSPRHRAALRLASRRYFGQLSKNRRVAVPAMLLPAIGNIFVFYLPALVVARMLDAATADDFDAADLTPHVIAFGASLAIGEVFWRIGIYFLNRTDARGIESLWTTGMDELLAKDAMFFHDNFAGSLTKRLVSYATKFENFVDAFAFHIVGNLVPLLFACVVLWLFSPWLVLTLVAMLLSTLAIAWPLIQRRQALVDEREAASAAVAGHVADAITNMEAIRSHSAELLEATAHQSNVARHRRLNVRSWDFHNFYIDGVVAPLSVVTNVLGLVIAIRLAGVDRLETVFVTFTYYAQSTKILFDLNQIYRQVESSLTEAAQFTELLLDEPRIADPTDPEPLSPADASVEFAGVGFRHADATDRLFDHLDLRVTSGEKIGLVGRSGGGKTTLTRLLLRLMDIDSGSITVGGQDIRRLDQADLRSQIAYVPQDPVMFHRTIRENISFGRSDATGDEVREAARAAHAHDFIVDLPRQYDTLVGERGIKLSGGQRQRVAIARAILRDAPILVLDEATSALDSESEALIQEALLELMRDRTALVVAHRLSTVQRMDRLIVIDEGEVIEAGSHDELIVAGGTYASLWHRQSGGFLVDEPA